MSYSAQEKYRDAEPVFEKACSIDPKEENACYYLGRTEFTLAHFDRALDAYRSAKGNTLPEARQAQGRLSLGFALTYAALGRVQDAERCFLNAMDFGDNQAPVDYGWFLAKTGRAEEGIRLLEKAGDPATARKLRAAYAAGTQTRTPLLSPGTIRFSEHALPMTVRNGAMGEKHLVETMLAGVAVFDFDGDGWPDIFVANGATVPGLRKTGSMFSNRLFRNDQHGAFIDVTAGSGLEGDGYSMGVAAGDFDNDGLTDLFVTGVSANHLYRNKGEGVFEEITRAAGLEEPGKWAAGAGWLDYDNDGLLDLFVVRYVVWNPVSELFCGLLPDPRNSIPGYRQYCHPSHYEPLPNALYHNLGGGRFEDVSSASGIASKPGKGMGVAFGDFDGDGRIDIFVANDSVPNFLFRNEGGGRFRDVALDAGVAYNFDGKPVSSMGADFRDLDNDGLEDLFVTALSDEMFPLFRNVGGGQFADITYPSGIAKDSTPWSGWSNGIFDFNNDGWKDLFAAGGHVMDNAEAASSRKSRQPNLVFVNRGGDRFQMQTLPGEALHRGAAFGDFNRDGRIDAVVTRLNESPVVLRNETPGGHWVIFRFVGHGSNRAGIGARIQIRTASGEQWNRVETSVGYGSSSDAIAHFGLGQDLTVQAVEITWPSGKKQTFTDLAIDRYHTIEEPNR